MPASHHHPQVSKSDVASLNEQLAPWRIEKYATAIYPSMGAGSRKRFETHARNTETGEVIYRCDGWSMASRGLALNAIQERRALTTSATAAAQSAARHLTDNASQEVAPMDAPKDMSAKPSAMLAGLRGTYWNAEHGTWVSAYDGRETGGDTSGGRWEVVCERHGSILTVETLKLAHSDARGDTAEFCEGCRDDLTDADDASACWNCKRTNGQHSVGCPVLAGWDAPESEATTPDNASDDLELRAMISGYTGESHVTSSEAAAVVDWCREWASDCEWDETSTAHDDAAAYWRTMTDETLLRLSHRHIVGGLAFVLADVRRIAQSFPPVDAQETAGDAETPREQSAQVSALRAGASALRVFSDHERARWGRMINRTPGTHSAETVTGAFVNAREADAQAAELDRMASKLEALTNPAGGSQFADDDPGDCHRPAGIRPAPWADQSDATRAAHAAAWIREAYVPAGLTVTDAQALTIEALVSAAMDDAYGIVNCHVGPRGDDGTVIAVIGMDSPAPNPIVSAFAGGNSYEITTPGDWDYWLIRLNEEFQNVVTVREDDAVWIILPGGTFERFAVGVN